MYCARSSGVACQRPADRRVQRSADSVRAQVYAASMQCLTYAIPLARMLVGMYQIAIGRHRGADRDGQSVLARDRRGLRVVQVAGASIGTSTRSKPSCLMWAASRVNSSIVSGDVQTHVFTRFSWTLSVHGSRAGGAPGAACGG